MPRQRQQEDFSTFRTMCCCKVLTCEQVVVPGFCPAVLEPWNGHSCLTFELLECQSSSGWFPLSAPGLKAYLNTSRLTFSRMLRNSCTMVKALNVSLPLGKLLLTQTFQVFPENSTASAPTLGSLGFPYDSQLKGYWPSEKKPLLTCDS